jgi:hypothetical protein
MKLRITPSFMLIAWTLAVPAIAKECPPAVTEAVLKAHAGATVTGCRQEVEDGKTQYEVKITGKDGRRIECDVSPTGDVLLTEEYLDVKVVPAAVMTAFAAKYPGTQATAAEKQTTADGRVAYVIAFGSGEGRKSVTFDAAGTFVEEEAEGEEGQD